MSNDTSHEAGREFIQEWLASLSPQEREAIDASFRECIPKLRQIETARSAEQDSCNKEAMPSGFDRVLSSVDEIEDFELMAPTVGIDPENLKAGEVVAIALEWVRQQGTERDRKKVIDHIRELRSKPSRQTALDNLKNDAMMNDVDIAVALNLPLESLRKRLENWRTEKPAGWQDIPNPSADEPRFIFRIGAIRTVLMEAIVASYRPPEKNFTLVVSDEAS
jgi:hypothetical protein